MGWLKKVAEIILKVAQIAGGIAPQIVQAFPGSSGVITLATGDLQKIADIITQIEVVGQSLGNLTGQQKLEAALPLVTQVLLSSPIVAGRKIADPVLFQKAVQEATQAVFDVLSSLDQSTVSTVEPQKL